MDPIKFNKNKKVLKSNRDVNNHLATRIRRWRWLGMLVLSGVVGWGAWGLWQQPRAGSLFVLQLDSEMPQPDDRFFSAVSNRGKGLRMNSVPSAGAAKDRSYAGGAASAESKPEKQMAVTKDEQIVNGINEGVRLLKEGDISGAIVRFNRVLELDARSEDAHFNLGIAYNRQGNAAAAIEHYQKAIELMPKYAEAYNNLGNLLTHQERYEEAITNFSAAITIMPGYASAHNNYGTVLVRVGRFQEAADHFQEAVRLVPEYVEAHFNLANTWRRLEQTEKAIQEYKETLRLRPGFEPALQALAKVQPAK